MCLFLDILSVFIYWKYLDILSKALKHNYSVEVHSGFLPINISVHFKLFGLWYTILPIRIGTNSTRPHVQYNITDRHHAFFKQNSKKIFVYILSLKDRLRIVVGFLIVFGITWVFGLLVINNDIIFPSIFSA